MQLKITLFSHRVRTCSRARLGAFGALRNAIIHAVQRAPQIVHLDEHLRAHLRIRMRVCVCVSVYQLNPAGPMRSLVHVQL